MEMVLNVNVIFVECATIYLNGFDNLTKKKNTIAHKEMVIPRRRTRKKEREKKSPTKAYLKKKYVFWFSNRYVWWEKETKRKLRKY